MITNNTIVIFIALIIMATFLGVQQAQIQTIQEIANEYELHDIMFDHIMNLYDLRNISVSCNNETNECIAVCIDERENKIIVKADCNLKTKKCNITSSEYQ